MKNKIKTGPKRGRIYRYPNRRSYLITDRIFTDLMKGILNLRSKKVDKG